jgi:hypothetical protein
VKKVVAKKAAVQVGAKAPSFGMKPPVQQAKAPLFGMKPPVQQAAAPQGLELAASAAKPTKATKKK